MLADTLGPAYLAKQVMMSFVWFLLVVVVVIVWDKNPVWLGLHLWT